MEMVDGSWRMTMQMSSGAAPYVLHWAYMTKPTAGGLPSAAAEPSPSSLPTSQRWSWLLGSSWALADTELFGAPGVGVFQIEGFNNGYFWGQGVGSVPFSVVGSVTPEGNLFLVLTPRGGNSVTRTGYLMQEADGQWEMLFRSYEGSPAVGSAWSL
jgi:hypothetical protein